MFGVLGAFCAWPRAANRQPPAVILSESTTAPSTPHKSTDSDSQSYGPHQRNRVARLHDAGPEPVVEVQMPIGEMILEMNVGGARSEVGGDVAKRQVVRRHQADGAEADQAAHQRFGAVTAIVRVGAGEDF